jgi:hypothetical protein
MAKPIKRRGKWKIRWVEHGRRCANVFESYEDAKRELHAREQQRDEVRFANGPHSERGEDDRRSRSKHSRSPAIRAGNAARARSHLACNESVR